MNIEVTLYKDEFSTHKQLNAVILEEVLRRIPGECTDPKVNEERSALFDHLFDEVNVAIENFLAADLRKALFITFNPQVVITTGVIQ